MSINSLESQPISPTKDVHISRESLVTDEEITDQWDNIFFFIRKSLFADTPNRHTVAEDLTQETMIKALAHKNQLRAREGLKAWLYQIAKNMVKDYGRKRKSTEDLDRDLSNPSIVSLESLLEKNVNLDTGENNGPLGESLTSRHENSELSQKQIELATKFIETIKSPLQREVFLMNCQGFGPKEIAQQLNMNENTARVMVYRTRKKFISYVRKKKLVVDENLFSETIRSLSKNMRKKLR